LASKPERDLPFKSKIKRQVKHSVAAILDDATAGVYELEMAACPIPGQRHSGRCTTEAQRLSKEL
jgi:hypothetical protein